MTTQRRKRTTRYRSPLNRGAGRELGWERKTDAFQVYVDNASTSRAAQRVIVGTPEAGAASKTIRRLSITANCFVQDQGGGSPIIGAVGIIEVSVGLFHSVAAQLTNAEVIEMTDDNAQGHMRKTVVINETVGGSVHFWNARGYTITGSPGGDTIVNSLFVASRLRWLGSPNGSDQLAVLGVASWYERNAR